MGKKTNHEVAWVSTHAGNKVHGKLVGIGSVQGEHGESFFYLLKLLAPARGMYTESDVLDHFEEVILKVGREVRVVRFIKLRDSPTSTWRLYSWVVRSRLRSSSLSGVLLSGGRKLKDVKCRCVTTKEPPRGRLVMAEILGSGEGVSRHMLFCGVDRGPKPDLSFRIGKATSAVKVGLRGRQLVVAGVVVHDKAAEGTLWMLLPAGYEVWNDDLGCEVKATPGKRFYVSTDTSDPVHFVMEW